jgi:TRAP transporter TAXI family solute receptor
MEAYGLQYADIRADYLSFSEIVQQLKNQTIDAGFINASYPVSSIMDLDASVGVKLIPVEPVEAEAIRAKDPNYFPTTIPAGTYKSLENDLPTVGVNNLLICRQGLEEDLVYRLTKLIFENQAELATTHQAAGRLSRARWKDVTIPLHPGSERFFREQESDVDGDGSPESSHP